MSLEDSIFFYTRNDYLIINSLLCNRFDQLWEVCEIVNNDSRGVLQEHGVGKRNLDNESIKRFENRIYETLNEDVKNKIKLTAKTDIYNILDAMVCNNEEKILYRTIWADRISDTFNQNVVNDIIVFNNISSTSTRPYRENDNKDFFRYEFKVPKNFKILELNQFDSELRNEDDEILLPPMLCKIISIDNASNKNCHKKIRLECLEQLEPNIKW